MVLPNELKSFSVPVTRHISGWVKIEAKSLEEAKEQAKRLSEFGLTTEPIEDAEDHDEVEVDWIKEITDE